MGYCYGFDSPGYARGSGRGMGRGSWSGYGRGMGRGRGFMAGRGQDFMTGRGRGFFGHGYAPGSATEMQAMNKDEEIKMLKSQMEYLSGEQKNIEKRLKELGKE
jgi:hypothetical protein